MVRKIKFIGVSVSPKIFFQLRDQDTRLFLSGDFSGDSGEGKWVLQSRSSADEVTPSDELF